jgi:hypothetical protein
VTLGERPLAMFSFLDNAPGEETRHPMNSAILELRNREIIKLGPVGAFIGYGTIIWISSDRKRNMGRKSEARKSNRTSCFDALHRVTLQY